MVPPFSLFRILITGFYVYRVVRRTLLFATTTQHGGYAKAHGLHGQRRGPVLGQNG